MAKIMFELNFLVHACLFFVLNVELDKFSLDCGGSFLFFAAASTNLASLADTELTHCAKELVVEMWGPNIRHAKRCLVPPVCLCRLPTERAFQSHCCNLPLADWFWFLPMCRVAAMRLFLELPVY